MPGDMVQLGREARARILLWTGIPVGVGIGPTKTLAKLANWAAKTWRKSEGVIDLRDPSRRDRLLQMTEVSEVWGVGRRLTARLKPLGIKTAWDLAQYDPASLRQQFSVVLEKTARELRGISCLHLAEVEARRCGGYRRDVDRAAECLPGPQTTIEDADLRVAEVLQQPEAAARSAIAGIQRIFVDDGDFLAIQTGVAEQLGELRLQGLQPLGVLALMEN